MKKTLLKSDFTHLVKSFYAKAIPSPLSQAENAAETEDKEPNIWFDVRSKALFFALIGSLLTFPGIAQVYTTKADGNWNSAATWVGGVVPDRIISAGKTVNIRHDVLCNLTEDIEISGVLNVVGDTLRFGSGFDKKTIIMSNGWLNIQNGGFIQDMPSNKCDLVVKGGRVTFETAKVAVSKTFEAFAGSKRSYRNSTIYIGETYQAEGTSTLRVIDTIINTKLEAGHSGSGDIEIKDYVTVRVANAKLFIKSSSGKLVNKEKSEIIILPGAVNGYGFNIISVQDNLDNDGAWDARIDAYCIGNKLEGKNAAGVDFTRPEDCVATGDETPAPELVFTNPILISGTANKEGAVYRFSGAVTGTDVEVTLKKFSRPDIVMKNLDNSALGWNKAFQPEFGLAGVVMPFQNWYIDFEIKFYEAGTSTKKKIQKFDITSLDVDGDGRSISEYVSLEKPSSISYSAISYLTGAGELVDGLEMNNIQGPIDNFSNIDTTSTQVMTTYTYKEMDAFKFRIGAKSGALSSNGSGIRLNSMWFRSFSLAPPTILPVTLTQFTASLEKKTVTLNWKTEMEENFSHFIIERSTDGKDFTSKATIFSAGDRNSHTLYTHKDNVQSLTGMLYYRLKSVDKTGETTYSKIRMIKVSNDNVSSVSINAYPNPVASSVQVTIPANWQGKSMVVEVFNANGMKVYGHQYGNASQTESIALNTLAKGFYVIRASSGTESAQQHIIKN